MALLVRVVPSCHPPTEPKLILITQGLPSSLAVLTISSTLVSTRESLMPLPPTAQSTRSASGAIPMRLRDDVGLLKSGPTFAVTFEPAAHAATWVPCDLSSAELSSQVMAAMASGVVAVVGVSPLLKFTAFSMRVLPSLSLKDMWLKSMPLSMMPTITPLPVYVVPSEEVSWSMPLTLLTLSSGRELSSIGWFTPSANMPVNSSTLSRNSNCSTGTVMNTSPNASPFTLMPFCSSKVVGQVAPSASSAITLSVFTVPSALKLTTISYCMAAVSTGHS